MSVRARARERLEARESRIVRRQENLLIEREKKAEMTFREQSNATNGRKRRNERRGRKELSVGEKECE